MAKSLCILYIDDNPLDRALVKDALEIEHGGFVVVEVDTLEGLKTHLASSTIDLVLSDFNILGLEGLDVLRFVRGTRPEIPVVIVTGTGSEEIAIEAMRQGAADYVIKTPGHIRRLPATISAAIEKHKALIERNRALDALRQSEERFQLAIQGSRDGLWDWNILTNEVFYSPRYKELLGYAEYEFSDNFNTFENHLHPDDRTRVLDALADHLDHGSPYNIEYRMRTKSGAYRWFHARGQSVWNDQGKPQRMAGSLTDIHDRKRSEQFLRQQLLQTNLLNQITRSIAERQDLISIFHVVLKSLYVDLPVDFGCICFFDERTDLLAVVETTNHDPKLAEDLGLSPGQMISLLENGLGQLSKGNIRSFSDTADTKFPLMRRLAKAGMRSLLVAPLVNKDLLLGVVLVMRRPVNSFNESENEFLLHLGEHVALAVNQMHQYEELQKAYDELRETQQAIMQQERLRAMGQMASGIAHDINNALLPITTYPEVILELLPELDEEAQKLLRNIMAAGEDIANTVSRLSEFYRKRERQTYQEPIHINPLIKQVIDLTRPRWRDIPQEHGIAIHMRADLDEHLPPIVGNESEIREALINMIFNGVDAMPEGGDLTLRTGVQKRHVVIEIIDTGTGMDEVAKQRCQEPFFTTKGERGTGLGLSMVYGIVQRHRGRIQIDSELGKGTTFRLQFPFREPTDFTHEREATRQGSIEKLYILCIDDDDMVRETLQRALTRFGHRVEAVDSGPVGLKLFKTALSNGKPFDVIMTDLGMPHMDGREVAKRAKALSPKTPIILLTGWGGLMENDNDTPEYIDLVVGKPPSLKDLKVALLKVMMET